MIRSKGLSDSHIVLLATIFISEANFLQLQLLATEKSEVLTTTLLCRQLFTFLPVDTENLSEFSVFLSHLQTGFENVSSLDGTLDSSRVSDLTANEAKEILHNLRINGIQDIVNSPNSEDDKDKNKDYVTAFLIEWLRKIDEMSGISTAAMQLVNPFVKEKSELQEWRDSYLLPLLRLQTEFYPGRADHLSLQMLEGFQGLSGVQSLLYFAQQDGDNTRVGRDLEEVVSPWVRGASGSKRRRVEQSTQNVSNTSWHDVNKWIYFASRENFSLAAASFLGWDGPEHELFNSNDPLPSHAANFMLSYVQTGLALIATSVEVGEKANLLLKQLLDRAVSLSAPAVGSSTVETGYRLASASKSDLLENTILQPNNPITYPSDEIFLFFEHCLSAQRLLEKFNISLSLTTVVDIMLFSSEDRQKQELSRILQQIPRLTKAEISWPVVREHLYTLQRGREIQESAVNLDPLKYTFLSRVSTDDLECGFLNALITNEQYTTIGEIYLDVPNPPLSRDVVRQHIVSAMYQAYDNASNGNRTRGGMKRAYELLQAFKARFSSTVAFTNIDHLIRATHSLSFYQLTLQNGVPFQPVMIRIMDDPLSLIEKVLAQNHKAFTKLDDLLEIGRNLVRADLSNTLSAGDLLKSMEQRVFDAQHHITYLAITSALSDHDFDTAYSYITTRLATSPSQVSNSPFTDDTSWKAAYAAGKYRPSLAPKTLHERIITLSKRMDLLSLALTLTPTSDPLSEILAAWRRCEEEMDNLKTQAVEEERSAEIRSGRSTVLPGGFAEDTDIDAAETRRMMERRAIGGSGPSYEEEAPMGLFDVARGAASAFRKSAFPLRRRGDEVKPEADDERQSLDEQRPDSQQRVRKRDVVSNMVTGGLVSGMSWVLGAQPAKEGTER